MLYSCPTRKTTRGGAQTQTRVQHKGPVQGPSCGRIHILQALQREGVAKGGREQNHNGVHAQALRLALQEDGGVHKTKHLLEREYGIRISIGRVHRLMKRMDLPRPSTSKPKASKSKAECKGECLDRVNRNFSVDEPDRIWCSDFTYIWTDEGWAFLCVVIDLFSRKVVSWSLMKRHTCALVCEAFRKAFWRRGAPRGSRSTRTGAASTRQANSGGFWIHVRLCSRSRHQDVHTTTRFAGSVMHHSSLNQVFGNS